MPTTSNFGWTTPADTDLVKDGALAIRTLGNGIDSSMAQLKGGTTGQVLSKTNGTDMAFTWVTQDDANAIQNAIVDAKGDLIAATANDTPARLAVGNNGETLVADSSQTTGLRYNPPVGSLANPVINGGMDIWQRGTSMAITAGVGTMFSADRWQGYRGVSGSTISRQTVSDSTNLPNIQYSARVQRDSGNTSTSTISFLQNIESANSIPFAGKTITVSFYARAGANYSPTSSALVVKLFTGTGTDQNVITGFTGQSTILAQTATLTTTWQRFAYSVAVGSTATQLAISLESTPVGTASTNDWFEATGVQIDVGTWTASTAPTFRRSGGTLAGELLAAQRYYQTFPTSSQDNFALFGTGYVASSTSAYAYVKFNTTMRNYPTVTFGTASNYAVHTGTITATAATAMAATRATADTVWVTVTVASGLTAGNGFLLIGNNTASAKIEASAEL